MRRVISVWFPTFPTDRLRRVGTLPADSTPFITASHDGRRRIVAAVDAEAQTLGITAGMPLAGAQALVPGLGVVEAEPEADAVALAHLAGWCLRYAPLVAPDDPDGLWIDATGCAHLAGGEAALLEDLLARLNRAGLAARAAIADTPGAAHALARYGRGESVVVPEDGIRAALAPLLIEALRLPEEICERLHRLGFDQVGQLIAAPRPPLVRRFGPVLALRLEQALGEVFETIRPLPPPGAIERRLTFIEPLSTAEAFIAVTERLVQSVCGRLDRAALGARRLDLLFERLDGSVQAIRVGTAHPSRDAAHLRRLLCERIEQVDPGEGVEAMHLIAATAEPLEFAQLEATPIGDATRIQDLSALIDRLVNRLGAQSVWRAAPVESDVPERSVQRVAPMAPVTGKSWPDTLPRPVRLLTPPEPVMTIAPLPDHPPAAFTWRRHRHRIRRADGPERITGEWWKRDGERLAVRDYFTVEDENGHRFWLFRRGDGQDGATGDLQWFLHGVF